MDSTGTLLLVLLIYLGAAAYAYRDAFFALRRKQSPTHESQSPVSESNDSATGRPAWSAIGIFALVAIGGVMVMAGTSLVVESGSLPYNVPLSSHELFQLLKDVIPGLISIILGFVLLEYSNRTWGGRGLRHG